MKIFRNIKDWIAFRKNEVKTKTLGFVPTMGALHEGHLSLVRKSLSENELTAVSIFLNPTQFNNKEDLLKYPVSIENDILMLEKLNTDFLILPDFEDIYPDKYNYKVSEENFSKILCGASRPGHFDGVLTVVMKLFMIIKPDRAYFGEKDYQQLYLIKEMCRAFFIDIEIVSCPIVREADGLAMSSRNRRLTIQGRKLAGKYAEIIKQYKSIQEIKQELEQEEIKVDYIEEHNGRRFAAVYIDEIRLIDNFQI